MCQPAGPVSHSFRISEHLHSTHFLSFDTMARVILTLLAVVVALVGAIYQLHFKPILTILGLGRVIEEGDQNCSKLHSLLQPRLTT